MREGSDMKRSRLHWLAVILLLLGGAVLRLYFVQAHSAFMQSDEALFGLMAKHIVSRGDLPIFAYGEERSGALVTYLVAPFFYFFGSSNLVFKTITTVVSLILVFLLYSLARRIGGNRVGLLTMSLSAFAPSFLIMWSVHAAAEYLLMMVCGVGSLLLCDGILFNRGAGPGHGTKWWTVAHYGLLGLLLGIGFWVSPLIISFLMAVWFALFLQDQRCFFRSSFVVFLAAFLIGNLPALLFNGVPGVRLAGGVPDVPNWVSYSSLLSGSTEPLLTKLSQVPETLLRVATVSMPPLVGGSLWEYESRVWRRAVVVILVSFWFLALIYTLGARLGRVLGRGETHHELRPEPKGWALQRIDPLIVQFLLALLVFSLSQYRWLVSEPRYLLPVFAFLLVAGACFLDWLWSKRQVLGFAVMALVVVLNVGTTVAFSESLDPDHGLWPKDGPLVRYLVDNGIRHPVTGYWNAYSIAFESDEKVIPVPIGLLKFTMYEDVVADSLPRHYLFPKREENDRYFEFFRYGLAGPQWAAEDFRNYLEEVGVSEQAYSEYESEHYVLFDVAQQYLDPAEIIRGDMHPPQERQSEIGEQLRRLAQPGDALILNPPELLERLGQPELEGLALFAVPDHLPLEKASAEGQLARLAEDHRRLYLVLGDTGASDPEGYVQGWLNRNAYRAGELWLGDLQLMLYGTEGSFSTEQAVDARTVQFGDWVELTAAKFPREALQPGAIVPLVLSWRAVEPVPEDLKVFVHLLDASDGLVAQQDSEPVGGLRPTSGWEEGETIEDRYGVPLPSDLPEGEYRLLTGLYVPATGDRLPVTVDAVVFPDGSHEIGSISVVR